MKGMGCSIAGAGMRLTLGHVQQKRKGAVGELNIKPLT